MSYYRECYRCGAALDPGEICDCREYSLEELISSMTDEQVCMTIEAWKIHRCNPEMTAKDCVKKAALVLAHQDGKN